MKANVNGVPAELAPSDDHKVEERDGRLIVRGPEGTTTALSVRQGDKTLVSWKGRTYVVEKAGGHGGKAQGGGSGEARAPMPGQIIEVTVSVGDNVSAGDKLAVLEAMKMQQPILAGIEGTVAEVAVTAGDQVTDGALLVKVVAEDALPNGSDH